MEQKKLETIFSQLKYSEVISRSLTREELESVKNEPNLTQIIIRRKHGQVFSSSEIVGLREQLDKLYGLDKKSLAETLGLVDKKIKYRTDYKNQMSHNSPNSLDKTFLKQKAF